jgi:hypothetical protein
MIAAKKSKPLTPLFCRISAEGIFDRRVSSRFAMANS